jgi:hypothetical protein
MASESIAKLPENPATMNLVMAIATFAAIAPDTARFDGLSAFALVLTGSCASTGPPGCG